MWCIRCNKELGDCVCPDLDERLKALSEHPNVALTLCSGCGEYHSRCKCADKPILETRSQGQIIATHERPKNTPIVRLENWSLASLADPYKPPEMQTTVLQGNSYGHPRFSDGQFIHTSVIVGVDGDYFVTKSGTRYELGSVDKEYEKLFPGARERVFKQIREAHG